MNKFAVILGVVGIITSHIYPQTAVVTDVKRNDTITVKTFTGFEYSFSDEDGDWFEGDICAMIMDDNGTEDDITDDIILTERYTGWIDDWENWGY
ncbi:MAG: hypothetical protein J6S67_15825 [Methanobrevibacter sp.]|nr:hypothetical protein [Methanobrevibacter sp.]